MRSGKVVDDASEKKQNSPTDVISAAKLSLPRMKLYSVLVVVSSGCTATVPAFLNNSIRFSVKTTPFLCPSCYREQHEGEVKELKGTLKTLKAELYQHEELLREVQRQKKRNKTKQNKKKKKI